MRMDVMGHRVEMPWDADVDAAWWMGLVDLGKVSLGLVFLWLWLQCMLGDTKWNQMPAKASTAAGAWRCPTIPVREQL